MTTWSDGAHPPGTAEALSAAPSAVGTGNVRGGGGRTGRRRARAAPSSTLPATMAMAAVVAVGASGALSLSPAPPPPIRRGIAAGATLSSSSSVRNDRGHHGRRAVFSLSRGGGAPSRRFSSSTASAAAESEPSPSSEAAELASQKRTLNRSFLSIALPALIQLAAEPLAGLVDTAYLGRLGPEVLGGAGVAISAQYAVSKLYNDPLLRTSISLVASEDGKQRREGGGDERGEDARKALSIAVSSALLLALAVGSIQLVLYFSLASPILRGMGVPPSSPMHPSAYSYLRVRALGTPAATLWLVANGVFRGLGDTATPLKYSAMFTLLNAVLDPFFIFTLKFGASGAAAGTALAQYAALIPLLRSLDRKVGVDVLGRWRELGGTLGEYLRAGSYVFLRTVGKVLGECMCCFRLAKAMTGSRGWGDREGRAYLQALAISKNRDPRQGGAELERS
ncbi:hypothetical protein ACHAWF_005096 [Thalassiosira exigua]